MKRLQNLEFNVDDCRIRRRSSRVTTSISPCSSLRIAFPNSGRSVFAPDAFSFEEIAAARRL
jgi:hypothetical protein